MRDDTPAETANDQDTPGRDPRAAADQLDAHQAGDDLPDSMARHGEYLPTPREIRRICLEIQAGWTPREERWHRAGLPPDGAPAPPRWTVPIIRATPAGRAELPE
jgi:hypothetical protein